MRHSEISQRDEVGLEAFLAALEGCWVPSVQVWQAKVNGNLLRQQRSMEILKRAIAGILM